MKKFFLVIVLAMIGGAVFAGGNMDNEGSLVLAQGKPEIDAQLKEYAAAWSQANGVEVVVKSFGGGSSDLGQQLKADYAAGEMPDIFGINGLQDYLEWESIVLDMSDQPWVKETSVAFIKDGKVYGFPVAVEGWGMAYNGDVLKKAGVDPAGLVNLDGYKAAFAKIDAMKGELGIDSVVSMAAGPEMGWVTAHHNFNSLLSNGLPYGDTSVVDDLLAGNVDMMRLSEYADWVELLYMYADKGVLTTGNYDAQVGAFASGNAAFLHQGNWTDPNMAAANASFDMAFAPHGSQMAKTDGIFVSAPSFYVINSQSKNIKAAQKFLTDLAVTEEGADYMVNKAGMIPAFASISMNPAGMLSRSVQEWAAQGKVYSWNQYLFSGEFRDKTLAPIYNQFANGTIDKKEFIDLLTKAFKSL